MIGWGFGYWRDKYIKKNSKRVENGPGRIEKRRNRNNREKKQEVVGFWICLL